MKDTLPDVSDTARWVAVYRAVESARKDALFSDPLAARLAGPRGIEVERSMSRSMRMNSWPMVVRTKNIDDLVAKAIAEGCDRVLNLAAGLDTRPYRLNLPADLTWVEADLPAMIDDKERVLAGENPVCKLVREKVDLADAAARGAFLDRHLGGAKRALVIAEGLLVYLDPEDVRALAKDLAARPAARWWIIDIASPGLLALMQRETRARLGPNAQMRFGPENGVAFFAPFGWKAREILPALREAIRLKRLPLRLRLFGFFPEPSPERPGKRPWGAVVRFERAD